MNNNPIENYQWDKHIKDYTNVYIHTFIPIGNNRLENSQWEKPNRRLNVYSPNKFPMKDNHVELSVGKAKLKIRHI